AEDGIRDRNVTGVQTCALPIFDAGEVAVVAGFQGADRDGNRTTLGRGGSDTTAVALAAALGAEVCEIYTDTDGIYTTDPHMIPRSEERRVGKEGRSRWAEEKAR